MKALKPADELAGRLINAGVEWHGNLAALIERIAEDTDLAVTRGPAPLGRSFAEAPRDGSWIIMMRPDLPTYGMAVRWTGKSTDDEWGYWLAPGAERRGLSDAAILSDYPESTGHRWLPAEVSPQGKVSVADDAIFIANRRKTESIVLDEMMRSRKSDEG